MPGGNKTTLVTRLEAWTDQYPELPAFISRAKADGLSAKRLRSALYADFGFQVGLWLCDSWLEKAEPAGPRPPESELEEARRIADHLRRALAYSGQRGAAIEAHDNRSWA